MVSSVCVAVLGNRADAEDAFQATFFVLARKAAKITNKERLGAWLHRVALRCALATLRSNRARMTVEMPEEEEIASDTLEKVSVRAMTQALHEQLDKLPEKYRVPLIAHYLKGQDHGTAARQLGISEVALRKRLERGRSALRRRLGVLGFAGLSIPSICSAAVSAGSRCVSDAVLNSTVSVAMQVRAVWAKGLMAATGQQTSLTLAEGVMKTMLITTLIKTSTAIFAGAFAGLIVMAAVAAAQESNRAPAQGQGSIAKVLLTAQGGQAGENADDPPRPEIAIKLGGESEAVEQASSQNQRRQNPTADPLARGTLQGQSIDRPAGTIIQGQAVNPRSGATVLSTVDPAARGNAQAQVTDPMTGIITSEQVADPISSRTLLGDVVGSTAQGYAINGTGQVVDLTSGLALLGFVEDEEHVIRSSTAVERTPIQHKIEHLEEQLELCRRIKQLENDNEKLRQQVQRLQRALKARR